MHVIINITYLLKDFLDILVVPINRNNHEKQIGKVKNDWNPCSDCYEMAVQLLSYNNIQKCIVYL